MMIEELECHLNLVKKLKANVQTSNQTTFGVQPVLKVIIGGCIMFSASYFD